LLFRSPAPFLFPLALRERVGVRAVTISSYFMGGLYERTDLATESGGVVTINSTSNKKYYSISGMTIAMNDGSGLKYLLTDHLGSVVAVTDNNGTLISQQRYLPFGQVRSVTSPSPIGTTDFGFTGQRNDSYINLLWYGSREYDPAIGRFISPDTIVPTSTQGVQAWDRYAYANNNPVRYNDPSGHCIFGIDTAVCIMVAIAAVTFIAENAPAIEQFVADDGPELDDAATAAIQDAAPAIDGALTKGEQIVNDTIGADEAGGYGEGGLGKATLSDSSSTLPRSSLIIRTYTYNGQTYTYTFDPSKPAALGHMEDLEGVSRDEYNVLEKVPDDIYHNTTIQQDFLNDITDSKIYPQILSKVSISNFATRVFDMIEMPYLNNYENRFGKWWQ
jgi:RHS repeat-associated protein